MKHLPKKAVVITTIYNNKLLLCPFPVSYPIQWISQIIMAKKFGKLLTDLTP